jgi:hypothetical protein
VNTCPGLGTPVAPLDLALSVQQMLPSARLTASASTTTKDFGAEFLTAHVLAVYASHPSGCPVEWQDSLPGCQLRLCPGWTFTNKIPLKGFIYSCLIPPFPSFAWRDSPDFSLARLWSKTYRKIGLDKSEINDLRVRYGCGASRLSETSYSQDCSWLSGSFLSTPRSTTVIAKTIPSINN